MNTVTRTHRLWLLLPLLLLSALSTLARSEQMTQTRFDAATAAVQAQIDSGLLAGAVVLIAQHGQTRTFEALGYQDLENRIPMQTDTLFRIFSMTKPVTGTARAND